MGHFAATHVLIALRLKDLKETHTPNPLVSLARPYLQHTVQGHMQALSTEPFLMIRGESLSVAVIKS